MTRKLKDSGIAWIGMIPEEWRVCRFKVLHSGTNVGESIDKQYWSEDNNDIPFYTAGLKSLRTNYPNFPIDKFVKENDLLLARNGTPYVYLPIPGAVYSDHIIRTSIKSSYNKNYIKYCLENAIRSVAINVVSLATWSASIWNEQQLPLPSQNEQSTIASWLDKKCGEIDELIDVEQKMIDELEAYRQATITETVTRGLNPDVEMKETGIKWIGKIPYNWDCLKLKNLCRTEKNNIKTGPFGTQLKGEDLQEFGDIPVYNQRNVIDTNFETVNSFVSNDKAKSLKSFLTKPLDILITSRGTIGRACILPEKVPMGILHPCLIAIRIDTKRVNLPFILYLINDFYGFKINISLESNGTTIEVIYTDTLKNIHFPLPPLSEQQAISDYLDAKCAEIDKLIAVKREKIETLKQYRQSLIFEAVTGKIEINPENN